MKRRSFIIARWFGRVIAWATRTPLCGCCKDRGDVTQAEHRFMASGSPIYLCEDCASAVYGLAKKEVIEIVREKTWEFTIEPGDNWQDAVRTAMQQSEKSNANT